MASDSIKKVLEAEAESDRKTAEARKRREDIINEAQGSSARAVQKGITDATAESGKLRDKLRAETESYRKNAEAQCDEELAKIRSQAEKNMDKAVDAIIRNFF